MTPQSSAWITVGHEHPVRIREPEAVVLQIEPDSIAAQLGLQPGDRLRRVNGQPPRDIIDYQLWTAVEELELEVTDGAGETTVVAFEKDAHEDLGITFEAELFIPLRTCNNGCLFCFVLQAPPGLRPTVYIKDDDYRLSFLHGHFTTLTNLTEPHFERIVEQRLSPLYVSIHASAAALRRQLLDNQRADVGWSYFDRLCLAGIECHTQIVLCPGVNDGPELDRTIADIAARQPQAASIAVVPVGLTRYQQHPLMRPMTRDEARRALRQLDRWRTRLAGTGCGFVYAADELYLLAERPQPEAAYYDDFVQVENGVGQTRLFLDDAAEATAELPPALSRPRRVALVTGGYGRTILADLAARLNRVDGLGVELVAVENELFGGNVQCAGLLCGRDMVAALRDVSADLAVLPGRALNDDGLLLDDQTPDDLAAQAGLEVVVAGDAFELVAACCGQRS